MQNNKSLPRGANSIRIFVSLGRATKCRLFFLVRRIVGNILCDFDFPHASLVVEKEHLINLLLIIFFQLFLFSSEPNSELLKLFFLSLRCCSKLLQLLLQLVFLLFDIFAYGLYSLFFLSHPMSLDLRRLHLLF